MKIKNNKFKYYKLKTNINNKNNKIINYRVVIQLKL